jgi:branched-chain amino acid transport system ATP-binding protein
MLTLGSLTKRFGGFTALNAVSFDVREGEILGLIGPNGSGKTTAFNCISGALTPTEGTITFRGASIGGLTPDAICHRGVARTFQIPRPFRKLSILENVAVAAHYGASDRTDEAEARRRARVVLEMVDLPSDPAAMPTLLGAAASRSSSWPARWPPGPSCCWPTRASAASIPAEMAGAADMLKRVRGELEVTIVWVEHIMATLMRDRGPRGRCWTTARRSPRARRWTVAEDPRVVEAYLGERIVLA